MKIEFIKKHPEVATIVGLLVVFYFIFFFGIGNYPLMDIDETRYVLMSRDMFHSKDFLTLYLNGDYFFEKPPLYFWGECFSFKLFGVVNEFTARFPVALYGMLSSFLLYFVGRKIVSRKYGIISALVLATSVEFTILSKYAILDILLAMCIGFSVYFAFLTYFVADKNKKYCWWLFYLFSGLAVMSKGIPGFIIPFGTVFFISLVGKKFKEMFRLQYIFPGVLIFLIVVLPWHILMFNIHDPLFFNEYVIKHHLNRFMNSSLIGRAEPFYYYFLVLLWGLLPWTFSAIAVLSTKFRSMMHLIKNKFVFENLTSPQKFLIFNAISFVFTFLFFSSSSTKLITYLIPVYFFTACLVGWIWYQYIENNSHSRAIAISVYIWNGLCLIAAVTALFMKFFLPSQLYNDLADVKTMVIFTFFVTSLSGIICAKNNKRLGVFTSYVAFIVLLSAFSTSEIFKLDYKFGQNDLIKFANYSKDNNYTKMVTLNTGKRFSLNYYGIKDVKYIIENEFPNTDDIFADKDILVVVKNKNLEKIKTPENKYEVIYTGRKYSLLKGQ